MGQQALLKEGHPNDGLACTPNPRLKAQPRDHHEPAATLCREGQEVLLNDGRPNAELLLATGSVQDNNLADCLLMDATLISADKCVLGLVASMPVYGGGRGHVWCRAANWCTTPLLSSLFLTLLPRAPPPRCMLPHAHLSRSLCPLS